MCLFKENVYKNFAKLVLICLAVFPLAVMAQVDFHPNYVNYNEFKAWSPSPYGGDFIDSTFLLDIRQGSFLSQKVSSLRGQSYETAFGEKVSFERWYKNNWTDFRVLWLTQIDKQNGIIWGLSTGEYGEKYEIKPGLTLGFIHQIDLGKNKNMTFYGTTVIGGELKEKSCTADYGEIGGIQKVNCRLAATTLQPSETLKYLMNEKPKSDMQIMVRFNYYF